MSGHRQICHPGKQKWSGPKEVCISEVTDPATASRPPQWLAPLRPLPGQQDPAQPPRLPVSSAVLESGVSKGPSHLPFP